MQDGTRFIANAQVPGRKPSIWVVPVIGGPPRKLRDDAFAGSVSRDGSWVAFGTVSVGVGRWREMWRMKPDGEQAQKLFEVESGFVVPEWSPDGKRLVYPRALQGTGEWGMVTSDLTGGETTTILRSDVWDFSWMPDGRMIYSLDEPGPVGDSCNFWTIRIDAAGRPAEQPKRLTNWAGFCLMSSSPTADSKKLVFQKSSSQGIVQVADLKANGTRMTTPRRLILNEGWNYPSSWTADSKAILFSSYRDGRWRIFKQSQDVDIAEPIETGTQEDARNPHLSPDGTLILYTAVPRGSDGSTVSKLMRVPFTGGASELVLTAPIRGGPRCAREPATLCVFAEQSADRRQLIFTAFDSRQGRGRELLRFDIDRKGDVEDYAWDLSPDGNRIAILKFSEGRIHILPVSGGLPWDVAPKGWTSVQSVTWTADGKGLFASSVTKLNIVLLRLDLRGTAYVLWEQKGGVNAWNLQGPGGLSAPWAVPSPDGRHVALYYWNFSANLWMMENF